MKIFNYLRGGEFVVVNPVNCAGVMGAGLALEIKNFYSHTTLESDYRVLCAKGIIRLGCLPYIIDYNFLSPICLFPTKGHWKEKSNIENIKSSLEMLALDSYINHNTYHDMTWVFPAIGCGLGGLKKEDVVPLIEKLRVESNIKEVIIV